MKHRIALTLILAVAMTTGFVMPVQASEASEDNIDATVQEEHLGLIASPQEMLEMGATEAEIAVQESVLAGMNPAEQAEQEALRAEQDELLETLQATPDVPVPPPAEVEPNTVTPFIFITWCSPGNDYYSVFWNRGNNVDCFRESGTYNTTIDYNYTTSVRPGNNVGRVYYHINTGIWYWSPWRGKSMTTYSFNGSGVVVQRVQIA